MPMNDLPHADAIALFDQQRYCDDVDAWVPEPQQNGTMTASSGVVDADGIRTPLLVQLQYRNSAKTRKVWYKFSVFIRHPWGMQRAYQLDVEQFAKPPKNAHDLPHEHMGDQRLQGAPSWSKWTFEQVLDRFSEETKITFRPPLVHPEHFELTMS